MSERSKKISKLLSNAQYRAEYIKSKLDVLIPSQIKALRGEVTQAELAKQAGMLQSRISAMETPGRTNFNLETLVRLAATFRVAVVVKFVPFSELLRWENGYSQDTFSVTQLEHDIGFLNPSSTNFDTENLLVGQGVTPLSKQPAGPLRIEGANRLTEYGNLEQMPMALQPIARNLARNLSAQDPPAISEFSQQAAV
ncbi:MAG: helix-turn-helix transcriptional regulator [Candidatus Korobacteraceae bacterium]|jgi:transcriptional regulator with XRE-family HTH domain